MRHAKLALCRTLLRTPASRLAEPEVVTPDAAEASPADPIAVCPVCQQGRMQLVDTLLTHRVAWDLSHPMPAFDTS